MKMKSLCTIMLLATGSVFAQPTISNTYIATLGDTVILAEDTANGHLLNVGTPGGDKTWDFTVLTAHNPDGAILEAPSTAPLFSNFPEADFVINDLEDSSHIFFRQTDSALDIVGAVEYDSVGNPMLPEFMFQMRFMQFPAALGDDYMSSVHAFTNVEYVGIDPDSLGPHPKIDSMRSQIYFQTYAEFDAWGMMQLPNGEFLALRQTSWNGIRIETDWYGNGAWRPISESPILSMFVDSVQYQEDASRTYRWWANNPAATFWLAQVEVDSLGNVNDTVSFNNGSPQAPAGVKAPASYVRVFPNPATQSIQIETKDAKPMRMLMMDVKGTCVHEAKGLKGSEQIDVSMLPSGIYLLQLFGADDRLIGFEKLEIAR